VLGEYSTYLEAQKIVDRLAKADFAVKGLAIVGNNLTTVERITGRQTYARAALRGAASGAWLGLFIGLLLVLFSPAPEFSFLFAAGFIGAGFGMIFGIVSYAISRRRRDFTSTSQVLASSYRVIVDSSQTARARQALAGGAAWPPPLESVPTDAVPSDVTSSDVTSTDVASTDVASTDVAASDVAPTDVAPTETSRETSHENATENATENTTEKPSKRSTER